jgi:hypothetical protein
MNRKFQLTTMVRSFVTTALFGMLGTTLFSSTAFAQSPPKTLTYSQGWSQCASEGNYCWFPGTVRDVAYGANGGYIYLLAVKDNVKCTNGEFWDNDPKPGVSKSCYVYNGPSRLAQSEMCAAENGSCSVTGSRTVWFGANGQFVPKNISQDDTAITSVACTKGNFGSDPNRGLPKYCLKTP